MTIFTKHLYKFKHENFNGWSKLLSKYYPNIKAEFYLSNQLSIEGQINLEFFQKLPVQKDYMVNIQCWSELATIIALPSTGPATNIDCDDEIKQIGSQINNVINTRIGYGPCEIYISQELTNNNFEKNYKSLSYIDTTHITQSYISEKWAVLILKNKYPIMITNNFVGDCILPTLDLNDGFSNDSEMSNEFNKYFKKWVIKFNENPNENWNVPIIKV